MHPISWSNVNLETLFLEGGVCQVINTVTSVCGMNSSARMKTQQTSDEAPNFHLWRSLCMSSSEDNKWTWLKYHPSIFYILSMKLHLLFFNVRGIKNNQKVGVVRDYHSSISLQTNVYSLQEHKQRGDIVDRNIRLLWRRDSFWSLETSSSNDVNNRGLGQERRHCRVFPS